MYVKIFLILFSISILSNDISFAKNPFEKKDSTLIYKHIESFAKRRKFTNFLYLLVIKPIVVNIKIENEKQIGPTHFAQNPYSEFEGKIIRSINVETLDPFGYSVTDTIITLQSYLLKAANNLHFKSKRITIRNLLLIKPYQKFDSLLVRESERLVRSQTYIHDVSFIVIKISKSSDSVDIIIRELDRWSIDAKVNISKSKTSIQLSDKNILGLGHEFKPEFTLNNTNGSYAYNMNYYIPNINNSFINATLNYSVDEFNNSNKMVSIDRPFFSPLAKWAAGLNFTHQFLRDSLYSLDSLIVLQRFAFNTQDYWIGKAIKIYKNTSKNSRTTNFIAATRYYQTRYLESPIEKFDTLHLYSNENFYLASIGISKREYVQDAYILKYGRIEDVPVGKVFSVTGGLQTKNNNNRLYLSLRYLVGFHYNWGYLSTDLKYGTFFNASHPEQGVFKESINYFTELINIGNWKIRQFVKQQLTIGINRFSNESITLNDGNGIDGFNSVSLTGTNRLLFTFQTQAYSPWSIIGFGFGPYIICSIGMLSNSNSGFINKKMYSLIGIGVLVRNEHLVFNTFQFSISLYPIIPGIDSNVFKSHSFKTTDFGFQDYEIGKPTTILY